MRKPGVANMERSYHSHSICREGNFIKRNKEIRYLISLLESAMGCKAQKIWFVSHKFVVHQQTNPRFQTQVQAFQEIMSTQAISSKANGGM